MDRSSKLNNDPFLTIFELSESQLTTCLKHLRLQYGNLSSKNLLNHQLIPIRRKARKRTIAQKELTNIKWETWIVVGIWATCLLYGWILIDSLAWQTDYHHLSKTLTVWEVGRVQRYICGTIETYQQQNKCLCQLN